MKIPENVKFCKFSWTSESFFSNYLLPLSVLTAAVALRLHHKTADALSLFPRIGVRSIERGKKENEMKLLRQILFGCSMVAVMAVASYAQKKEDPKKPPPKPPPPVIKPGETKKPKSDPKKKDNDNYSYSLWKSEYLTSA